MKKLLISFVSVVSLGVAATGDHEIGNGGGGDAAARDVLLGHSLSCAPWIDSGRKLSLIGLKSCSARDLRNQDLEDCMSAAVKSSWAQSVGLYVTNFCLGESKVPASGNSRYALCLEKTADAAASPQEMVRLRELQKQCVSNHKDSNAVGRKVNSESKCWEQAIDKVLASQPLVKLQDLKGYEQFRRFYDAFGSPAFTKKFEN